MLGAYVRRSSTRTLKAEATGFRTFVDAAVAVLLAPACGACARPLNSPTRGPICAGCWAAIVPITPPICDSCGEPLPSWRADGATDARCPRCRRSPGHVSRGRAIGSYEGSLRAIVHALKYDGRPSLAGPLAALMKTHGAEVLDGADVCVPVPLHRARQRSRGFNQAAELARHLGLPVMAALRRERRTPSQTDLPAPQRLANVLGAFVPARRSDVRGLVVVLVDDVSTTGATLDACARVLLDAGAREVRAVTAAKVGSRKG